MTRRRKRPNLFGWTLLGLVLLFGYYFNQVYLPAQPNPFDATPTVTRSPESFVTEAEALFKDGKLLKAIESYQSAIDADPQNPALYIALAKIQVFAGQYEEAESNAQNALLLSPENSMAHAVLAWALDFQPGRNSDAMEEIDKAITLDPQNAIAHAFRVEILIDSGSDTNVLTAIEVSKTALGLNPDLMETRRARAYLLEATGNYEEAIQFHRSAIELSPNLALLHMELGQNLRIMEVYEDAIREFTLANTLNPPDPEPDRLISRTYATMGDYAKALQYAETASKDRPMDAALRANYGVMYYRNFEYEKAVEQLELAINGGQTEDGFPIKGLPLENEVRTVEYYFTYGMALARTYQCGEALRIVQEIQTKVRLDDASMEVVNDAVNRTMEICQENLDNPPVTPSPTELDATAVDETAPPDTETPEPVETPTP
jgi:tetratricopeptide (TPR) repeat protein